MSWAWSSVVLAGCAGRARIVLVVADGAGMGEVFRRLGVSRLTVIKWRDRFVLRGVLGLDDEARSGCPNIVDDAVILRRRLIRCRRSSR